MNSTGNDLESSDILDFSDNCVNLDTLMNSDEDYWVDRFNNKKPTIDYALRMAGFTPAGFDFTTGGVLKNGDRNKCVFNQADQTWYSWSGNLPYNVIAGSAPGEGWKVVNRNALTIARETLRRTYLEAGYNLVDGSFEQGAVITSTTDVVLHEKTGKCYSGPIGNVPKGTDPLSSSFVDKSDMVRTAVTYAGIRAYTGSSMELRCIGREHLFDRGNGDFARDDNDTKSKDNDGTILLDALGRRWKRIYKGGVLVDWFGAVDDGLSSTPTDSYAAIQAAINSVTAAGSQGGAVELDGAYYSSQTIVIDYRPNPSHFVGGKDIGVFALRGKTGMHHDKIIFPETCDSGINSNPTNTITSVQMHDFAVIRLGFDASIYAPRTGQRSPNTFDPRYGYGIRDSTNGYSGIIKNIYIYGFYTLLQVYQGYAARYEGIFAVNKCIYGCWWVNCSTVHVSDSTFGGYQAGWCADKGLFYTENVTIEGNLMGLNSNPALLSSWDYIGFQFTDASWIGVNDYCEKLGGPCIDALNSRVDVNSRAMSNGQWWEVNTGTTLSAAAKAALLAKDPNLTNIKWVVSAGKVTSAVFRGGFTREEKMYLQDGGTPGMFVANNTEVYIPATSIEQAAEMFTNQRAARITLANVVEQWTPTNQMPASRVAGCLEVRLPYSTNYTGFSGLSVGRNKASAWGNARNKFEYIPTTDDLLYMYRSVYDSAGVETKTTVWAPYGPSGHEFRRPIYAQTQVSNGLPTNLWSVVYAASSAISTSDGRYKTDVRDLSEKEHAVAKKIKGLLKAFRFKEAVDQKGVQNARIHFGVIAQDVEEAFKSEGLSTEAYGLFCFDEWEERPEIVDESGEIIQEYRPAGSRYGVRYEELLCFVLAAI